MPRVDLDPTLRARVTSRRELRYAAGASPAEDRPAHVRAGSGVAWWHGRLAVIQDDARFVALCDPETGLAEAVALPPGPDGLRLHDDSRGTKALKLDLEACVAVSDARGPVLLAFGSGSTHAREQIVIVREDGASGRRVEVVSTPALYAMLRACERFAGSELNVEGVAAVGRSLRLFQRGNGARRDGRAALNATSELDLATLLAHLARPMEVPPPRPERVVQWELPEVDGVPFGFTDAFATSREVLFLAAAERSATATDDGPVSGVAIGRMALDSSHATLGLILAEDGAPLLAKAEGVAVDVSDPGRLWVVLDRDDPAAAAELLDVRLG